MDVGSVLAAFDPGERGRELTPRLRGAAPCTELPCKRAGSSQSERRRSAVPCLRESLAHERLRLHVDAWVEREHELRLEAHELGVPKRLPVVATEFQCGFCDAERGGRIARIVMRLGDRCEAARCARVATRLAEQTEPACDVCEPVGLASVGTFSAGG